MTTFTPPTLEELQEDFPQYRIEGFIAQGGMGAVYLARQVSLDRPVAIKILPQEFGEDADYRASFETEAKAMARLNHSNLVGIYDFGEIAGMLFIVMEYVPGRTLFDTANGQQVDEKEAARLIADMSEGLAHAHDAGMLHRDIKPANVLIDDDAKPKIVDFGLARPIGEEQTAGVVFGTPGYTAPEVMSNPYAVDHRSDIFSMGVMLYELLTGHLPGNPVIPVSRASNSDPRFDAIIAKSIHPNPAMRYGSADNLSKDLDNLIENFDNSQQFAQTGPVMVSVGRPVTPLSGARPTVLPSAKKSNTGAVVITLLLLAIGGIAIYMANSAPKGPSAEEVARVAAAKRLEEQRQKEIEAERKLYAAKQSKEREEEKQRRFEQEQKEKLAEEERRQEVQAMHEMREREKLAQIEAEKKALEEEDVKEVEEVVSNFDLEGFLAAEREVIEGELAALEDVKNDLVEPVFDGLERRLKRVVRGFSKGEKGKELEAKLDEYMESVREFGEIADPPRGFNKKVREEVIEEIDKYRERLAEAIKTLDDDKDAIRLKHLNRLKEKKAELLKIDDKIGAESLDDAVNSSANLEVFLNSFEE